MVDRSKFIIAVFDQVQKGGTWNCLESALKKDKKVFVINPFEKKQEWFWCEIIGSLPLSALKLKRRG